MIGGITTNLYQSQMANQFQQMRVAFQKLGTDLQSGNVAAAQQDFSTLTEAAPFTVSGNNPMSQQLTQLGKDLDSGDLSAAQRDFADLGNSTHRAHVHHGHPHSSNISASATDPLGVLSHLVAGAASSYLAPASALSAGSILSAVA